MKLRLKGEKKAEILIYEDIGGSFFGGGLTAKSFAQELKKLGELDEINVRINSTGGDSWDAAAIYNALVRHPASVVVDIDGVAASAASYVAMAADPGKLRMAANADFMIHRAWAVTVGDHEDMERMAGRLIDLDENQLDVYGKRASVSRDKLKKLLDEETWLTAKEAKKLGFVDEVTAELKVAASLDFSKFKNTPAHVAARFPKGDTTMPEMSNEELQAKIDAAVSAAVTPVKAEHTKAIEKLKADHAAELAAIKKPADKSDDKQPTLEEARAQERTRTKELTALYQNAGLKEATILDRWIDKGVSVLEAKGEIADLAIKQGKLVADDSKGAGENNDPKAKYRAEYAKDRAIYASMGIKNVDDYIKSRMVDDGLAVLEPEQAA